jgi:acyl carrier protein
VDGQELIHSRLEDLFRRVFDDPELVVTRETTAAGVPAWDSLSHIVLMVAIEDEFGVRLRGPELDALRNVGDLEDLLSREAAR